MCFLNAATAHLDQ